MPYPVAPLALTLFRMLTVRFQRDPYSGEGARLLGGRWNARGTPALYLATDPATAVAEFYQGLPKPGTLAPYSLAASAIADLTDGQGGPADATVEHACTAAWKAMAAKPGRAPPSWSLAEALIGQGAEGALVPSVQNRGGVCLVLWRWHGARDAAAIDARPGMGPDTGPDAGAALTLIDPEQALRAP